MQVKQEKYDTAVIVGRFQVHELHSAHRDLIQSVCDKHEKVIIFLGLAPVVNTKNNPLDFESRKQMIQAEFPNAIIAYIKDVDSDALWSKTLDKQINDLASPTHTVVLYGSRGSFLDLYQGKYPTIELEPESYVSGTDIRTKLSKSVKANPDFRAGVIWASANRFPTTFTTVDVAIFNDDYTEILLGRKENEEKFRLIGGFADPRDGSFEHSAAREMMEETSLGTGSGVSSFTYLGSYNIDDWRYRNEVDCIRTLLYAVQPMGRGARPGDDIHELRWFDLTTKDDSAPKASSKRRNLAENVVPQHHEILARSLEYANQMQNNN